MGKINFGKLDVDKIKEKKKSELQIATDQIQDRIKETNQLIVELGEYTNNLNEKIEELQAQFDAIRNVKSGEKQICEEVKQIRENWVTQVRKIKKEYEQMKINNVGVGVAGVGAGVAVASMGPTFAMGVATTFGVASTGAAISSLSGAAASSAALAWLGGGALAAGGGGIAAGEVLLAMAGPVGWGIAAGAAVVCVGVLWKKKSDYKNLERIFLDIALRDLKKYELAIVELHERITKIIDETDKIKDAIGDVKTFGLDYNSMTETQQYTLGAYVNLMNSSAQLLVNPIIALKEKYTQEDYNEYALWDGKKIKDNPYKRYKNQIIFLSNLFYDVEINANEKKMLCNSLKKNEKMLEAMKIKKEEMNDNLVDVVSETLYYQKELENNS
ncbi:hypothetical protein [Eubacterium oxidoreducens]|uniref:Uncharacterized protein n=1 Tax=Eubacterium oxidoreducens TaxID=1732 RepID=A0A1G6AVN7_EUBOX|nr:hypothetical protein [Eubacterium oxidoreducens]SDB12440.1 hypothetical protein SAMN02910417_00943 [Eubacterium oxidoreducens]